MWTAKKLFLTNDPFNKPQLMINNNNFVVLMKMVRFGESKWTTIVLDNFIRIPAGKS